MTELQELRVKRDALLSRAAAARTEIATSLDVDRLQALAGEQQAAELVIARLGDRIGALERAEAEARRAAELEARRKAIDGALGPALKAYDDLHRALHGLQAVFDSGAASPAAWAMLRLAQSQGWLSTAETLRQVGR